MATQWTQEHMALRMTKANALQLSRESTRRPEAVGLKRSFIIQSIRKMSRAGQFTKGIVLRPPLSPLSFGVLTRKPLVTERF